jgi:RNA polymerase sigma-70 factor (ECF subfamily)
MIPHANDPHYSAPMAPSTTPPSLEIEEQKRWQRAVEGNEEAFAQLFRKHYAAVRGLSARLLLNLAAAEDVAQETFVRAARALPAISGPTGFRP